MSAVQQPKRGLVHLSLTGVCIQEPLSMSQPGLHRPRKHRTTIVDEDGGSLLDHLAAPVNRQRHNFAGDEQPVSVLGKVAQQVRRRRQGAEEHT